MIEKISTSITHVICNKSNSNSKFEIIEYGIECIINTLIPVFLLFIYCIINKTLMEMIIWICLFLHYRNLIGGYHASSHIKCILLSTIYCMLSIYAITISTHISIQCKLIIFIFCFIIHSSMNPIIHHEEDRNQVYLKHCKIKIMITLSLALFFMFVFNYISISISNSIFIAIISAEILYLITENK